MVLEEQTPEIKDPQNNDAEAQHHEVQTDVHMDRDFVQTLQYALRKDDETKILELLEEVHAADVADILEVLSSGQRTKLIALIGANFPAEVLAEIEGEAQDDLYEQLPNEQIAEAVTEMETDDAVYVLEELDEEDRAEVLEQLPTDDRVAIEESLSYPEDSAGRLMQRDLFAIPEFWTVGQTIDYLRSDSEDIPDDFYDVFIVDPTHKPIGSLPLSRILRTARETTIADIMRRDIFKIEAVADQEEVAYQFSKYHLISASVVDDAGRLVGVITVDDVVDVIGEEAEEDILALGGVRDESGLNESFIEITRGRFTWLFVNLLTAILASAVIGMFEATIEQMVALAVLMPIVASMGGNAGTQTMTVSVRAIATKELSSSNALRVLVREFTAAGVNGTVLAVVSGLVAWFWFDSLMLGGVFAAAMIFNMVVAGLCGLLIPMGLYKMEIDPAISSSVFVTTITDVVGFFAFLGMAALFLL
ncbi:magnesium transporter [Kordiimonas sp. SCSIO 12603]|uniref:magnesium transporter n=1 Tax=Kordiimonas sp. SCSIO 12603 TaxID=2829596 RepID=UPI0021024DAD|nr:magnesium transporter [Kordiimonas sp. SCSIO 12603]UTW57006.1 magnesium transporter [Kordiimonas sp. SCSIO 12603]